MAMLWLSVGTPEKKANLNIIILMWNCRLKIVLIYLENILFYMLTLGFSLYVHIFSVLSYHCYRLWMYERTFVRFQSNLSSNLSNIRYILSLFCLFVSTKKVLRLYFICLHRRVNYWKKIPSLMNLLRIINIKNEKQIFYQYQQKLCSFTTSKYNVDCIKIFCIVLC